MELFMRSELVRIIATIKVVDGITIIIEYQKVVTKLKFHTLLPREETI
jgi:hypothetical protein